eukprot:323037-Pleurochrysis_carterae.AAC.2
MQRSINERIRPGFPSLLKTLVHATRCRNMRCVSVASAKVGSRAYGSSALCERPRARLGHGLMDLAARRDGGAIRLGRQNGGRHLAVEQRAHRARRVGQLQQRRLRNGDTPLEASDSDAKDGVGRGRIRGTKAQTQSTPRIQTLWPGCPFASTI